MEVRCLEPAHREVAVELWGNTELTRPWNDPRADFERALSSPHSTVLGSFDVDLLAATVMVGEDGHRGWVYYLAVRATHRRQGLGCSMMDAAEQWLGGRGVSKLNLMVRSSNHSALGFYRQLGYRDDDVTVLSRWLSTPS
ncbi:MAG: GNAT family acetyltransferase [Acidimicrobiales bacterium]